MTLKKLRIAFTMALLPVLAMAQTDPQKGMSFESGLNWKQIQAKAKAENKYIFVDCYATWCGPCKWMSANIFPDKKVGDYMNSHFINVAIQMDKTPKDDQQVKNWYLEASSIHDLYKITAYPTYLFFSPDGVALHRFTGSRENAKAFLDAVNDTFDPTKQYYSTMKQWKSNINDTTFLFNAYLAAKKQRDGALADSIGEAYLKAQPSLFTRQNMNLINECHLVKSSKDKWFKLLVENASRIDKVMNNQNWAEEKLCNIIFGEIVFALFDKNGGVMDWKEISAKMKVNYPMISNKLTKISEKSFRDRISRDLTVMISQDTTTLSDGDWLKIIKKLNKQFPGYDKNQILLQTKMDYYADKKLWATCINIAYVLIKQYGNQIEDSDINNIAWYYIFHYTTDPKILTEASKWMKHSIDRSPNRVASIDTYANLLYKLGQREQALAWENKAIETAISIRASSSDLDDFKINLTKMQEGQPTWRN
ncbi:MAG TPA: DUF255 domain-containing protein [Mucilaginibacter sp.]|nr:DUF255 domain-containing protein [Mucilaginibacter sp.]